MAFITEDFLLQSKMARRLYHTYAAERPILDYHCHLSARDIAENRQFRNLYEIWLEGDHYKWRAMRANGVSERYCTGDADPYDKYFAWAQTVPHTLRNPLYHWTHLELQRYFGIDSLLNEKTARKTWDIANEQLADRNLSTQGILKKFKVTTLCTTDDPVDSLAHHERIASHSAGIRVFPGFRPDKALRTEDPAAFNDWVDKLAAVCNLDVTRLPVFFRRSANATTTSTSTDAASPITGWISATRSHAPSAKRSRSLTKCAAGFSRHPSNPPSSPAF